VSAFSELPANLVGCCTRRSVGRDPGKFGHLRVVLVGDPCKGLPRSQRQTRSRGIDQIGKFSHSHFADPTARAFERHSEVFWKGFEFDDSPADAVRD